MSKLSDRTKSRTDWKRVDAMTDDEIVYDEDTGPPLTEADIAEGMARGFVAHGLEDFKRKMARAARAKGSKSG